MTPPCFYLEGLQTICSPFMFWSGQSMVQHLVFPAQFLEVSMVQHLVFQAHFLEVSIDVEDNCFP